MNVGDDTCLSFFLLAVFYAVCLLLVLINTPAGTQCIS